MTDLGAAGYDGVLELRIHGVNNTSPSSMLDLGVDDVELVPHIGGDESAGFWRAKETVRDRLDPQDRGYTPEGLTREAYSWGGLARTSPDGFGFGSIKTITGVLGRLAWILLIPFGLVNIAYWSRRLPERPSEPPPKDAKGSPDEVQGDPPSKDAEGSPDEVQGDPPSEEKKTRATGVWSGRGSASIRIFALGSTMLLVVSACDVTLDVIARQCYRSRVQMADGSWRDPLVICGRLPSQLDSIASWSLAQRLAAASIVPVLLLLLLWWVIRNSRTRYEKVVAKYTPMEAASVMHKDGEKKTAGPPELDFVMAGQEANAADHGGPQLTARRLWSGDRLVGRALGLHLAAAMVVVAMSTSWAATIGPGPKCRTIETTMHGCREQLNKQPYSVPFFVLTLVALIILLIVAAALVATSDDAPDVQPRSDQDRAGWVLSWLRHPRTSTYVLVGAFVTFAAEAVLLAKLPVTIDENRDLPGLLLLPMVLVAGMLGIAMSALAWRNATLWTKRALRLSPVGLGLAFGVLLLLTLRWRGWYAAAGAVALALTVIVIFLASHIGRKEDRDERRDERERTAWNGKAPGVFLMLSLAVSLLLSSLVTVTSGDWLNNGGSASTLIRGVSTIPLPRTSRVCLVTCEKPPPDPVLIVPTAYVWFGVMSLVTLVGMVVFLLYLLWVARGGDRLKPAPETGQLRRIDANVKWSAALGLELERRKARRFASITHRAEILVGVLALFSGISASSSVLVSASLWHPPAADSSFLGDVIGLAVVGVALAGLTLVGALVGGKVVGGGRPLGLLWDLMCFLPRAGHPFGPPCYAERAVPDLLSRCKNWLGTDVQDTAIPGRRVVLSAHSLGSVLAAATVFNFREPEQGLSLLTYGSQLRGYFSRLLPELLGPAVLGVTPCIGSVISGPDPWSTDSAKRLEPLGEGEDTLRARLTGSGRPVARVQAGKTPAGKRPDPRWVSLWRRTDYIGFPVFSYPALPAKPGARPLPEPPLNVIDRAADERDTTGMFVTVATHGDYPRAPQYDQALIDLLAHNHQQPTPPRT